MKLAKQMRRVGQVSFVILCVGMGIAFIGLMTMPYGGYDWAELPPLVRYPLLIGLVAFVPTLICLIGANIPRALASRKLQADGLNADARILKVWATGMRINRSPVVRLLLEVRPPGQPTFQAETEQWIASLDIPNIQPGAVLPVKYNPQTLEVALADRRRA